MLIQAHSYFLIECTIYHILKPRINKQTNKRGQHGRTNGGAEKSRAYNILVGTPEGKGLLGRPSRRWEGNFKMDNKEIRNHRGDSINVAQDSGLISEV
jgi:hypothetical protein